MHFFTLRIIFCLLICSGFWSGYALASDSAYLDALDAEAEASDDEPDIVAPVKKEIIAPSAQSSLQVLQQKIEFTTQLSHELPATSRAYYKLNEEQKKAVIDTYFESNKSMSKATHLLFNLYFKNKSSN